MKIKDYKCKCGHNDFFFADKGSHNHKGIYCSYCGKWIKWADQDEQNLAMKQESKTGHWILTDVDGVKVWHCKCSKCNKDPLDYVGGSENWWLIKTKLPKFCPYCGLDMRKVEE